MIDLRDASGAPLANPKPLMFWPGSSRVLFEVGFSLQHFKLISRLELGSYMDFRVAFPPALTSTLNAKLRVLGLHGLCACV